MPSDTHVHWLATWRPDSQERDYETTYCGIYFVGERWRHDLERVPRTLYGGVTCPVCISVAKTHGCISFWYQSRFSVRSGGSVDPYGDPLYVLGEPQNV